MDKANKYVINKRKTDPIFRLRRNISKGLWAALQNIGSNKNEQSTMSLLGFTKEELGQKLLPYLYRPCDRCKNVELTNENSHMDHILPLSLAQTKEEIIYLNQLHNLRLICKTCNLKKRDNIEHPKLLENFYQYRKTL